MELKLDIYQRENVKPLSPTPETLRTYKLSLLDQVAGTFYMPLVFFYGAGDGDSLLHDYDALRDSLSKALSVLYPLAGRQKDEVTIECGDEGADFLRANVTNCDLDGFLRFPKLGLLRQLFPRDPYPEVYDPSQPLLAVQVNRFRCGGTAVAICLWHALTDGSGLVGLLQTWSAFNRGAGPTTDDRASFVVDATAIFSPVKFDFSAAITAFAAQRGQKRERYIAKRFVFSKNEIERLKDELVTQTEQRRRPTRVEALSAFMWAAVLRATLRANPNLEGHMLTHAVDLRRRLDPPFPATCLGNINHLTAARWVPGNPGPVTAQSLVASVRESLTRLTNDYVRKMHENGGYLWAITEGAKLANEGKHSKILSMSSWFKFECLKIDFGWGKPKWLGPGNSLEDLALLLDAQDGGIEVWIGLPRQTMYLLDKDDEFTSHVTFSQIVWEPMHITPRL